MKKRLTRKQRAPRNAAARALRSPLFQPRVIKNPKAYVRRKGKFVPPPEEDPKE
jgi:hypothetical protein